MNIQIAPTVPVHDLESALHSAGLVLKSNGGQIVLDKCDHRQMRKVTGVFQCRCGQMIVCDEELFDDRQ